MKFPLLCTTRKKLGDFVTRMNKEISNVKPVSEEEEKSPGIFQKIFYIIIIPLLFVIALLLIVAQFSGTNVFEKVTEWIPKAETETPTEETFQHQR